MDQGQQQTVWDSEAAIDPSLLAENSSTIFALPAQQDLLSGLPAEQNPHTLPGQQDSFPQFGCSVQQDLSALPAEQDPLALPSQQELPALPAQQDSFLLLPWSTQQDLSAMPAEQEPLALPSQQELPALPKEVTPTYVGRFVPDPAEAKYLIDEALDKDLTVLRTRPNKEFESFWPRSGHVIVFKPEKGAMERWTDCVAWSNQRPVKTEGQEDYSLYREVFSKGKNNPAGERIDRSGEEDAVLAGCLRGTAFDWRLNGLLKRVFKPHRDHILVSYYRLDDARLLCHQNPIPAPNFTPVAAKTGGKRKKDDAGASLPSKTTYKNDKRMGMRPDHIADIYRPLCNQDCGQKLGDACDYQCPGGHTQF